MRDADKSKDLVRPVLQFRSAAVSRRSPKHNRSPNRSSRLLNPLLPQSLRSRHRNQRRRNRSPSRTIILRPRIRPIRSDLGSIFGGPTCVSMIKLGNGFQN